MLTVLGITESDFQVAEQLKPDILQLLTLDN